MKQIDEIKSRMVSYACHKTVKASPMSELEYAKLMKNPEPYEDEPGYIVMYEDGYISWFPKEVFEGGYKLSETFTDRLVNEMEDLGVKVGKLEDFLLSDKSNSIDKVQKELLTIQLFAMRAYYSSIIARLKFLTQTKEQ